MALDSDLDDADITRDIETSQLEDLSTSMEEADREQDHMAM